MDIELVETSRLKPVKMVYVARAVPEECAARAQVMIVTGKTWHLIGPAPYRAHGDASFAKPPKVGCVVIDVSGVAEVNDERMGQVIAACTAPSAGVINMDGLVTGLCALGGKVSRVKNQVSSRKVRRDLTPSPSPKGEGGRQRRSVSDVYASK